MVEPEPPRKTIGILIGPGSKNTKIIDGRLTDHDVGIENHGADTKIERTHIGVKSNNAEEPKRSGEANAEKWHKKPIWFHPLTKTALYIIGVLVAGGLTYYFGWK